MQSFSNVILGGHLGDDPTIKGEKDKCFAYMRLAVNRKWKKEEVIHEATDWISVTVPTWLVSVVQNYARKGDPLVVEGELRTHQWTKGEEKRSSTYVLAKKIMLVKSRAEKETLLPESSDDVPLDEAERNVEEELPHDVSAFIADENHLA